ncbi:hypothetical protein AALO_G00124570 [Alosa alosa]|uniref:Leucine-rich repeat-containing protein 41 n=1 Tax=Alosa alosa TaxID=278164 RepID=A0AAV6GLW0_9TELE|nr:leucine-rich repeat-containing protein 41 [Alosa alosa]KAG5275789.1 hypothetical protein AALO_G00124570 [Alosa alosa]
MAKVETSGKSAAVESLVQTCIKLVCQHMSVLEERISDLPASLLKDILPHLNIVYLDRIESAVQSKGISTSFVWEFIFKDLVKTWRCRPMVSQPYCDWKQKSLERLFHVALYTHNRGDKKYLSNLSEQTVLSMTVSYVQTLSVVSRKVCRLASVELKPILSELERGAGCLKLLDRWSPWTGVEKDLLYILHRLLDHGSVKDVEMGRCYGLDLQNWITTRCRRPEGVGPLHLSQESVELPVAGTSSSIQVTQPCGSDASSTGLQRSGTAMEEVACKRRRITWLWDMPTEFPCDTFLPKCGPICPKGQINSLDMQVTPFEIINVVSPSLPFWRCLHTLHLHNERLFKDSDLQVLVNSLQMLCSKPGCILQDLSMAVNDHTPVDAVLEACPSLRSLSLDVFPPAPGSCNKLIPMRALKPLEPKVFLLEKLSVKSSHGKVQVDMEGLLTTLRQTPNLRSLHVSGIHPASPILSTLAESNKTLKSLTLDDINLASCHCEILHLLENSLLQDICLKDCQLLDKCTTNEDFLVPFVKTLKGLCSLQSLALPENRLAKSVKDLAELFSGNSPSSILKLDLSSNYILPADLLEFSTLLSLHKRSHHPSSRLILDLRLNPLDRDQDVKERALRSLIPFCHILTDSWDSRSTMADHISMM